MTPEIEIDLTTPYLTGTVTIVDGVVTLAGGTWPTWAAQGTLVVDSQHYNVDTRDSDGQITLEDLTLDADALTTYELRRLSYTLADDFGGFVDPYLSFSVDNDMWYPVRLTGPEQIWSMRQTEQHRDEEQPLFAAVIPLAHSYGSTGQRFAMLPHPTATTAGVIRGKYYSLPENIDSDTDYPLGGQPHAETLLQSCLASSERMMNDERGIHQTQFQDRLAASVRLDKEVSTPKFFGYNGDKSNWSPPIERHRGDYVTYNGVAYLGS